MIPSVVLCSKISKEFLDLKIFEQVGFSHFLEKPIDINELK